MRYIYTYIDNFHCSGGGISFLHDLEEKEHSVFLKQLKVYLNTTMKLQIVIWKKTNVKTFFRSLIKLGR